MTRVECQVAGPSTMDGPSLADWAEAAMFVEDRKHMSRSSLRQRLRGALSVEANQLDVEIDLLLSEISRRGKVASQTYPFSETSMGLERKGTTDEAPYEFLLWLSVSHRYREEKRYNEIDKPFDTLVKHALVECLGPGARAVRFAFPSSDGRPAGFPEAVCWLADLLNLNTGAAEPRSHVKDGGVDVVGWRPFRDRRSGFIVILCQCTVELDWPPKAKDIVVGKWKGWIDFGLSPMSALAIPFSVPFTFDRWDELRRTVTMVLDRMRLCELIEPQRLENLEEIRNWAQAERKLLGAISEE